MNPVTFGPSAANENERRREVAIFGHILTVGIERVGPSQTSDAELHLQTNALIDTGASDVCIDYRLAEQLGLKMVSQTRVGVVGSTAPAAIYMGRLKVPEIGFDRVMPLYALKLKHPSHEVLLGRSFLQSYVVTFNGPSGMFHFAGPAAHEPLSAIEDDFAT